MTPKGRWVRDVHLCELPQPEDETEAHLGDVWECECGKRRQLRAFAEPLPSTSGSQWLVLNDEP